MARPPRTAELLGALDAPGAVGRWGALTRRHGRAALRDAVAGGGATLILPRIYAQSARENEFAARVAAAMEWLPGTVALTGLAACAHYGLLEEPPDKLRAAAPSPLHVRSPRWLVLRRCVVAALTHESRGVRVVSVAEALVHAWEEDPRGLARDAIFAALREGLVTVSQIREALAYYPRVRGRGRFLAFLAHLRDGMHSYLEYLGARTVLNTPDLRGLEYQRRFVIEGNTFYADRYDPITRTAIEFDGMRWHGTPEARERDRWRDGLLSSIAVATLRLPYADVAQRPARCRSRVRATIAARAAPP